MKIGFVLDDTLDSFDGVQQYILTLGSWMTKHGHQVHYLVGETSRKDINNLHSLSKNLKVRFNKNTLSIPLKADKAKIKKLLKDQQFDILHIQLPYSPLMSGIIIDNAPINTKIIGTFHILPYSKYQFYGAKALSKISKKQFSRFGQILSVSPPAKTFAKQAMNIDTQVIPNAVDFSVFKKGKKLAKYKGLQTVVFLGRLVKRKGCIELVKAVKHLVENNQFGGKKLIIAGTGIEEARLKKFVSDNYLQHKVEFLGRVSESQKADLFAGADLVALPSISGESFGIVVVEAIVAGAGLVLGGNNPGYSYVLADSPKTLFDPTNTDKFARLISKSLDDKEFITQNSLAQRDRARNFDVNIVGKDILGIYKSVIANSKNKSDNI